MASKSSHDSQHEFSNLPDPCDECAETGGYWARAVQHHSFQGKPQNYDVVRRCSCARGRRLAEMDAERQRTGKAPAGAIHTEQENLGAKLSRWRREWEEEQRLGADEARRRRWDRNECPAEIAVDKAGRAGLL